MITIKARVVGENIELLESPLIASKSRYTVQLDLEFDEVWDGFGRTALFWGVDDEVYISQIANGKTTVPHEALDNHGRIKFGVYGTNGTKRIVTIKVTYKVVEGAYSSVASESIDPSPDLIDQIETSIGELESVINGVKNSTVRFDANQELTDAQKEIARGNIDATTISIEGSTLRIRNSEYYNRWRWAMSEGVMGIQKHAMGYDSTAHVIRLHNASISTNRRTLVTEKGIIPFKVGNTDTDTEYYPVPVPASASRVTIQLTPSSLQMACHINQATMDGKYNQMTDTGWMSSGTFTFAAGSGQFLTMGIRADANNSAFTSATEPSEIVIEFGN